ncbi:MAG: putative thiamine-phosphate synthase [Nitrospiraceae bacterium]|nr:MAG: putative thiamine-phosphate synthase [Nitrospiraceae bacterium]
MTSVDFRLYLVTDRLQTGGRPLVPLLSQAIDAGVSAVQLRGAGTWARARFLHSRKKSVRSLGNVERNCFINDRVDLVNAVGRRGRASAGQQPAGARCAPDPGTGAVDRPSRRIRPTKRHEPKPTAPISPCSARSTTRRRSAGTGRRSGIGTLEDACRRCRIPILPSGASRRRGRPKSGGPGAFGVAVISAVLAAEDVGDAVRRLVSAVTSPV